MTVTETRRRTSWPADLALVAAVLMAGSVSRHAVYTPFGVALLVACVLALAVALRQGAARVVPSRPVPPPVMKTLTSPGPRADPSRPRRARAP